MSLALNKHGYAPSPHGGVVPGGLAQVPSGYLRCWCTSLDRQTAEPGRTGAGTPTACPVPLLELGPSHGPQLGAGPTLVGHRQGSL